MNKKIPGYVVSPLIQKLFIALGIAGYIAQLAVTLPLFFSVYGGAWRFSQYTYSVVGSVLFPLLLAGIAYASASKQSPLLWRLFQSVLFAMVGLILQTAIVQLLQIPMEGPFVWLAMQFGASMWYQAGIILLTLLVYVVIVRRYTRGATTANNIVQSLQHVIVVVAFSMVAILVVLMLSRIARQLPDNPNLSSFITTFLSVVIVPAVLFVAAYLSNRKQLTFRSERLFDAALLSLMGSVIVSIITGAATIYESTGIYEQWVTYEIVVAAIALAIYMVMLWFVRRQPRK